MPKDNTAQKITRDRQINIKLTETEFAEVRSKALKAGMSQSEYIREKLMRPGGDELRKILRQVVRSEIQRATE